MPRHQTHFEPSCLKSNDILLRGEHCPSVPALAPVEHHVNALLDARIVLAPGGVHHGIRIVERRVGDLLWRGGGLERLRARHEGDRLVAAQVEIESKVYEQSTICQLQARKSSAVNTGSTLGQPTPPYREDARIPHGVPAGLRHVGDEATRRVGSHANLGRPVDVVFGARGVIVRRT